MISVKNQFDKLVEWFLNSGIQNKGNYGGFNAWYDMDSRSFPYVYSEITGYGITALLYLNDLNADDRLILKAKSAADWILNYAMIDCGGILTRNYLDYNINDPRYSFDSKIIYAFDTGMVLFGLVKLYKINGEKKYLEVIRKIGNFLLTLQRKDGLFEPIYDAKTSKFVNMNEKWSTQSGSFHAKLSLGLLEAYDVLNDIRFKDAAQRLCDAVLRFQKPEGRFVSFEDMGSTHMHPHSYTCEGLYFAGKKLKNEKYLKATLKGTLWALHNQLETGGMPCLYSEAQKNINERSDTLAQVLRMAIYFTNEGIDFMKEYRLKINFLTSRLLEFQNKEIEQSGGFFYGYSEDGKKLNHINSWCSMFALESLGNLYKLENCKKITPDYLI